MLQFERTCRCCMVEMETEAELYDFSSEIAIEADQFVAIISVFNAVTSIKILKADEDYSKICPDCLQELKNAYVFRMKTLQNDRKFRQELIKKRRGRFLFVFCGFFLLRVANFLFLIRLRSYWKHQQVKFHWSR